MTVQATAISKWGAIRPPGSPEGDYRFTEVAAETKEAAIQRAEKVNATFGSAFGVVWDEEDGTRRTRLADGREMPWEDCLDKYGVQLGLIDAGGR
jgi:hypothetical protein